MKEHIHTIPVLDALREPDGCPFCAMYRKLDGDAVSFILGPAYMDEDIRAETDKTGFCAEHIAKLYAEQNRLGVAMMLHTHLRQINRDMETITHGKIASMPGFKMFMKNKEANDSAAGRLYEHLRGLEGKCYLCARIKDTLARYMDTFFYLWARNSEAAELIKAVPGYCLPHFAEMLQAAGQSLDKTRQAQFLTTVIPRQQAFMREIENDLDWFIQKFDYRNTDKPWKNAKDALPRAMKMLY